MPRAESGSHGTPSSTASSSASAHTRSGAASVASITMRPPIESPTSTALSISRWSSSRQRSSACEYEVSASRVERPNPADVVADHPCDVLERRYLVVPHASVEREPVHEHDRNAVALGLVVQLAARHPQDRHNAIVLRGNRDEGIEPSNAAVANRPLKRAFVDTALLPRARPAP